MSHLDSIDEVAAEAEIAEALQRLGVSSDQVADAVRRSLPVPAGDDALCHHLQQRVDPDGAEIRIDGCDGITVDFSVVNPDGETWTQSSTALPWPVLIFYCRLDDGEFIELMGTA